MQNQKSPTLPKTLILGILSILTAFSAPLYSEVQVSSSPDATEVSARSYSDSELFNALGQYMALSGAVADLQLNDAEINEFAAAVAEPMVSPSLFESLDEAQVRVGIDSAIARLDALEAGNDAAPLTPNAAKMVGYVVAMQSQIVGIEVSPEEGKQIEAGAKLGARMKEPSEELMAMMGPLSGLIEGRVQKAMERQQQEAGSGAAAQRAAGQAFLAELAANEPELKTTDSGLRYLVVDPGKGKTPAMSDTVRVHYHGTLIDGSVFDSSVNRGQPADFPLRGVVPGFSEGLQKVGVGGKVRLFIPADLAYGDNARPGSPIPGGALIIFDCELIAINP